MEQLELRVEASRLAEVGMFNAQQIVSDEKAPIYLNVDSGFDYGALVSASIGFVVAIIVARFTVGVQRNQIQANISNFRHQWMVELRECASELIQLMAIMINALAKKQGYAGGDEYVKQYSRAIQLRSKIDLLLSRDDKNTNEIRRECGGLLERINMIKLGDSITPRVNEMVVFQDLLRKELERAWRDTKNDLGGRR